MSAYSCVCVFVCLYVREHISETARPIHAKLSVRVPMAVARSCGCVDWFSFLLMNMQQLAQRDVARRAGATEGFLSAT